MATLRDLRRLIDERVADLDEAPPRLVSAAAQAERRLYTRLLEQLGRLERQGELLAPTDANLRRVAAITEELRSVLTGREYRTAVAAFAGTFTRNQRAQDALLRRAFPDYAPPALGPALLQRAQRRSVERLLGVAAQEALLAPIRDIIDRAVVAGTDWRQLVRELRRTTLGEAKQGGLLQRHVTRIATDALATTDRAYALAAGRELGAEWYLYAGTELPTTRDFCRERLNRFYRQDQVQAWAGETWDGKIPETTAATIFTYLGGYNCRHVLVPVSASVVPADVRAAAGA